MNRIATLRLNVAVGDQNTAFAIRQKLRAECLEKLLPILDSSVDKLNVGERWLHINTLEIKVTINNAQSLEEDFYQQCYHELNQLLSTLAKSGSLIYADEVSALSMEGNDLHDVGSKLSSESQSVLWSELDIVLCYLASGQAPWFIETSQFKQILVNEVRMKQNILLNMAIKSSQLSVWFRTVDLLLSFATESWVDELIEQLNSKESVLMPVYRHMLYSWIARHDMHTKHQVENILTLLAFVSSGDLYAVNSESKLIISELTIDTWRTLIDSIPDWSDDEQALLVRTLPNVLEPDKQTAVQANSGDISKTSKQLSQSTQQEITFKKQIQEQNHLRVANHQEQEPVQEGSVKMQHAGLVILAPFLKQFLLSCEIEINQQGIRYAHLAKAAALLYALVRGHDECREYDLGLIKILLGVDLASPIMLTQGELCKADFVEIDNLIKTAIVHWSAVGKLSIDGFRQSFLERSAILTEVPNSWNLSFERAGYDVLIDQLPWALERVRLPWMKKTININW